ncbi:hypothetical protein PInf_001443 [Phytophthora infestans]|nr:hypothetical protein PInf_001443 [Phytophthora infestans]
MLPKSPALEDLSFASCSQLEQVLVDPGDLPALRRLDLSGCPKLCRVHVTSKLLEYLDLSRNDNLQYVLLDLERMVDLDLSFLKNLTHLYIRSSSLRRLNLRGCDQLMRNTTSVTCPNLQYVVLQEEQALWVAAKSGDLAALSEGLARLTPETRFYSEWRDPVYGYSPLANACSQGHLHCVHDLLAYGVDCNARDSQGNTPLHIATACGKSEVVRLLLETPAVDYFAKTSTKAQTALDIARQAYRVSDGRGLTYIQCVEHIEKVSKKQDTSRASAVQSIDFAATNQGELVAWKTFLTSLRVRLLP